MIDTTGGTNDVDAQADAEIAARVAAKTAKVAPARKRPVLDDAALHGLAGEIVRAFDGVSEADPPAMLIHFLVLLANAIGRSPHWAAGDEMHFLNMFAAITGPTGTGRKGTSYNPMRKLICDAEPAWKNRLSSGLSSGEGLIHDIRDPSEQKGKDDHPLDEGEPDKRMMVVEGELAALFAVMARSSNTLSAVVRNAWDGVTLRVKTKNSPAVATDPMVSIIGHITPEELRSTFADVDIKNGLGNRFLWVYSQSDKYLPQGARLDPAVRARFVECVKSIIAAAKYVGEMGMTDAAWAIWGRNGEKEGTEYFRLRQDRPGLAGFLCSRAHAQVRRLACIYALIDHCTDVDVPHLRAALAVWNYCEATVTYVFGESLGNRLAEDMLAHLEQAGPEGIKQSAFYDLYGRNKGASQIRPALEVLEKSGKAFWMERHNDDGGRPARVWVAAEFKQPQAA